MNSTTEIVSMIAGKGTLDDDPVRYEMAARIDSRTGKFHGTYDVDGGGDLVGNGLFSRLAKRAWDLKLKWGPPVGQPVSGAGPTVPQSIYELGNFDLSIDSQTTHLENGKVYDSFTRIGGSKHVAQVAIVFHEGAMGRELGFPLQTSFSTFENAGPGKIRFVTRHRDAGGEHSITNGMIRLNGNPTGVLSGTVRTNFCIEFQPICNAEDGQDISGRFRGAVEIFDDTPSPYDPADYFKTYDHKASGAGAIILYKYVPEISTLGLKFERYPDKEQLPAFVRSEDGKFSVALRTDSAGALHLSALVEVEHSVCNNAKCSADGQSCVTTYFWRCYCVDFDGAHWCNHQPCPSGGDGGIEPSAVDFAAAVPGGEW